MALERRISTGSRSPSWARMSAIRSMVALNQIASPAVARAMISLSRVRRRGRAERSVPVRQLRLLVRLSSGSAADNCRFEQVFPAGPRPPHPGLVRCADPLWLPAQR